MKGCIVLLCLLLVGVFAQISIAQAVSRTYTWQIDTVYSTYEVFITTQDHWKTDTNVDVIVRLTLTHKHWSLDHTRTNWMQLVIKSSKFIIDSGKQEETVILTNVGDYWEKTISMQIPSEKLEQGETLTMSIAHTISIDEMDTSQHKWWNHIGSSGDNPIQADVYRPTFWETPTGILVIGVIGLGIAIIVVGAIVGTLIYRKSKKPIPSETPKV